MQRFIILACLALAVRAQQYDPQGNIQYAEENNNNSPAQGQDEYQYDVEQPEYVDNESTYQGDDYAPGEQQGNPNFAPSNLPPYEGAQNYDSRKKRSAQPLFGLLKRPGFGGSRRSGSGHGHRSPGRRGGYGRR